MTLNQPHITKFIGAIEKQCKKVYDKIKYGILREIYR